MLPWYAALAAAGHVLLLAVLTEPTPRLAGGRPAAVGTPVVVTRVNGAVANTAEPVDTPQPAETATGAAEADTAASAPPAITPAGSADAATSAGGAIAAEGYLPRPLLSVPPQPLQPVVIAPPPAPAGASRLIGRYTGVLALYIDEQGIVRSIEAEPPALPEAMERAAREAFQSARFTPGQVDGRAVKSRIRVEVAFDDSPPQAAPAASTPSAASRGEHAASGSRPGRSGP